MRKLTGFWDCLVKCLSVMLILFQLYTTGVRLFSDMVQRSVHLAFVLTLVFILKPARKGHDMEQVPWYDVVFAVISCVSCIYVVSIYKTVVYNPLQWISTIDKVFAVLLVILILEASRRSVGWTFPILGIAFLIYAFYGEKFPGMWAHQNFSFNKVFQTFYHGTTGIWGTMLGLSATMLAMFGIFGAILAGTGGAETFIKIGQRVAGRTVGGSGKIAVIASSLFGMISGSAIGNVVATGVFTIPSMQRAGYSREWSAAIEAISSTGGQILPPIMGAAAFIMAQLIGVNYLTIARAAIVPAVLYYLSCFLSIHLISKRDHIQGESGKPEIKAGEYLVILIPLAIFLYYLLRGYTVMMGAFWATAGALVTYAVWFLIKDKSVKKSASAMGHVCFETALKGTNSIVEMCGILAGSQITISLVSLTGFGVKLSDLIVSLGQDRMFLCLLCSMLVCIVLGMGLPTTAAYVLGASVLAPALIALGVAPLAAHLFVMYYACLSAITPPVCVAVFMASGLAKAKWIKVAVIACMVSIPVFVIPYTFVYNPALMLEGNAAAIVVGVVTALMGVCLIDMSVTGYWNRPIGKILRGVLMAAGLLLLIPDYVISAIGFVVGAAAFIMARRNNYETEGVK